MTPRSSTIRPGPSANINQRPLVVFLAISLGLGLGVLFFYAGIKKHLHPYDFTEAVMAYRLLPLSLVGLTAAVLPWVEIIAGFLLVVGYLLEVVGRLAVKLGVVGGGVLLEGVKRRSCLLILAGLCAVFILLLLITLARGLKIDCGCGLFFQQQVGWLPILEDSLLLALTLWLYYRDRSIADKKP